MSGLQWRVLLLLALVPAAVAPPPFDDGAAMARLEAAEKWWLGRGAVAPPPWWMATAAGDLDGNTTVLAHGNVKTARRGSLGGAPVVVKAARGGKHRRYDEPYTELLYLEFCRGLPGVPALRGGWFDANRDAVYVVDDAGATIDGSEAYADRARKAPLDLARAWLRLGESFAQIGGYILVDFKPSQFSLDEGTGAVSLVDGPRPSAGPAFDYMLGRDGFWSPHGLARPKNVSCTYNSVCRTTTPLHCCCGSPTPGPRHRAACGRSGARNGTRAGSGANRGAPEALGACTGGGGGGAPGTCAPLTYKTHVFDFANRNWILGVVADAASGAEAVALGQLRERMSAADPDDRPTFTEALAALERYP